MSPGGPPRQLARVGGQSPDGDYLLVMPGARVSACSHSLPLPQNSKIICLFIYLFNLKFWQQNLPKHRFIGLFLGFGFVLKGNQFIFQGNSFVLKGNTRRPPEVSTALIRRYFATLTRAFEYPLERYVTSLMPLKKQINPFKPYN